MIGSGVRFIVHCLTADRMSPGTQNRARRCRHSSSSPEQPGPVDGNGAIAYVPVYPRINLGAAGKTFDLTVTLTVRNTDLRAPITVHSVTYHDATGRMQGTYLDEPLVLAPLASADHLLGRTDPDAGNGGSFIVQWTGPVGVSEPLLEAVMIGSASQMGISLVREGRVIDRTTASEASADEQR